MLGFHVYIFVYSAIGTEGEVFEAMHFNIADACVFLIYKEITFRAS